MKTKLSITALAGDGSGLARDGRKTVFVPGALPGEEVTVQIVSNERTWMSGRILSIESESPARVAPPCPWYGVCGGCRLQHATYEEQLALKRSRIADLVTRGGGLDPAPEIDIVPSPDPWRYRSKMIFPVRSRSGRCVLGFFKARSHGFVPIDACPVTTEGINASIGAINEAIASLEPYREETGEGVLRHVILRSFGEEPPQVTFVLRERSPAADCDAPSLWRNVNPDRGNVILGAEWEHVRGYALQEVTVRGMVHRLHPGSFFQANRPILDPLLARLEEGIDRELPLIDLYGGAGFLGLQLARSVPRVTVLEENPLAVQSGRESLLAGVMRNVEFVEGAAEDSLRSLLDGARSGGVQLVVDPPRKGLGAGAIATLLETRPARILYLSCNPASFARDLAALKSGYHLERLTLLDFFPQTAHAEMLGVLIRDGGASGTG